LNREFNLNVEVQFLWELVANSLIMQAQLTKEAQHV
jgi:hypothetical protein